MVPRMARLACALVVVGCGSVATTSSPEPPEPAMVIGEQGWCGTRPWHRAVGSRDGVITFAVATDTLADVPRIEHPTFENGDKGWCCHDTARTFVHARLRDETIELLTPAGSCADTALGCLHGGARTWGRDVFARVTVPPRTCIHYLVSLPGGHVLGTTAGTFAIRDGVAAAIAAPVLEQVSELEDQTLLQEHDGPMWRARWEARTAAPTFAPVAAVKARTLALTSWDDIAYAFTADALIVLDAKTLVERWRVPGEVHGVLMPDNGSSDAAFLRIDRTGPQPRAVLDVRSQARHVPGPIVRSRVVYQGPTIIDAGLRIVDSTYEVTIAPR